MSTRTLEIPRHRLTRWVGGFLDAHGPGQWSAAGDDVLVTAADGATARLCFLVPGEHTGVPHLQTLVRRLEPVTYAVVLVRRGGFAVGVARGGELLASKVGSRYVQGRTAAGGWSQQRYARRRENQADALARAVADVAADLFVHRDDIRALAVGGDKPLVRQVLSDPRLSGLDGLARRELDTVAEPRRAVLEAAAARIDAVRVLVTDPQENTGPTSRELLAPAAEAVSRLVAAVPEQAWGRPSPCEGWSAREVLNHLVSEHLWAPHLLRGESIEQVGDRYDGDVLGAAPVGAWTAAIAASLTAWEQAAVDEVHVSHGEIATAEYAQQVLVDLTVHGWDIARATTTVYEPVPDAVDAALRYETPRVESHGVAGIFAAPQATASTLRIDQLVALLGRDPNWRA